MIELLVSMVIIIVVIALTGSVFARLSLGVRANARDVESSLDNIIGTEIVRLDLAHVGYGVAVDEPLVTSPVLSWTEGAGAVNRLLTFRSTINSTDQTTMGWALVDCLGTGAVPTIIIDRRDVGATNTVTLLNGDKIFSVTGSIYAGTCANAGLFTAYPNTDASCNNGNCTLLGYQLVVPGAGLPTDCAPGTFVLNRIIGGASRPIMTCVADMLVKFDLDTTGDGFVDTNNAIAVPGGSNANIVSQVKNIDIFLLMQTGRRDDPVNDPFVGDITLPNVPAPNNVFDIAGVANFNSFDWKVVQINAKPMSW